MLLTTSERVALERIRDDGAATVEGLALALENGWVEHANDGNLKLTFAAVEALLSDEAQRGSGRRLEWPRRSLRR
jgi:hypothetical protein